LDNQPNSEHLYKDASKITNRVGQAIITKNVTIVYKFPPLCSIFTAESTAIYKAVEYILNDNNNPQTKFIILSVSLSSLKAIQNMENTTDLTKLIQGHTYKAQWKEKQIHFIWIPGHIGIPGNETADNETHIVATSTEISLLNIYTYSDVKKEIQFNITNKWHLHWRNQNTKLSRIKNNIHLWQNPGLSRKEEMVINRLKT